MLAADPSAKIVKSSYITGHRRAITDQERAALLQVAETDPRFNLFLLMLFCGCRPSEAMAAQGQDIQQIDGYPVLHIRGAKTANADRFVPIPEDFVPYCLRHTYCTDLQKKGVDIRTAQYLMGHADIQMTANVYTHADQSTITKAAELIAKSATVSATFPFC